MPYQWSPPADDGACRLRLWPHQSMTPEGFVWFVGLTAAMSAVPLVAALGTPVVWAILPFVLAILGGVWAALRLNARAGRLTEELALTRDRIEIVRSEPRRGILKWEANPHWVRLSLHARGGPVENYLTLNGSGREVELGAFLSPEERVALHGELAGALARLR